MKLYIHPNGTHYHFNRQCRFVEDDYIEKEVDSVIFWRSLIQDGTQKAFGFPEKSLIRKYHGCPACVDGRLYELLATQEVEIVG